MFGLFLNESCRDALHQIEASLAQQVRMKSAYYNFDFEADQPLPLESPPSIAPSRGFVWVPLKEFKGSPTRPVSIAEVHPELGDTADSTPTRCPPLNQKLESRDTAIPSPPPLEIINTAAERPKDDLPLNVTVAPDNRGRAGPTATTAREGRRTRPSIKRTIKKPLRPRKK